MILDNMYFLWPITGANYDAGKKEFLPSPTSYDFDAPITEGGDFTVKYFLLRSVIQRVITIV